MSKQMLLDQLSLARELQKSQEIDRIEKAEKGLIEILNQNYCPRINEFIDQVLNQTEIGKGLCSAVYEICRQPLDHRNVIDLSSLCGFVDSFFLDDSDFYIKSENGRYSFHSGYHEDYPGATAGDLIDAVVSNINRTKESAALLEQLKDKLNSK